MARVVARKLVFHVIILWPMEFPEIHPKEKYVIDIVCWTG